MKKLILACAMMLSGITAFAGEPQPNRGWVKEVTKTYHNVDDITPKKDGTSNHVWHKCNTEIVFHYQEDSQWASVQSDEEIVTYILDGLKNIEVGKGGENTKITYSYGTQPSMDVFGNRVTATLFRRMVVYSPDGSYLREYYNITMANGKRKMYK